MTLYLQYIKAFEIVLKTSGSLLVFYMVKA